MVIGIRYLSIYTSTNPIDDDDDDDNDDDDYDTHDNNTCNDNIDKQIKK
jgi:hypothetical protein